MLQAGDKEIPLDVDLSDRQKDMLMAGGLLDYTKKNSLN